MSQEYKQLRRGPEADTWFMIFYNELGRLSQGLEMRMSKDNDTISFITRGKVPNGKMVTYGRIVEENRSYKAETHIVCITVGGDRL